ncbi:hypothetical protein M595_2061 [Lyngbya aestuarii BL J]|uniref:Uncharacterized protein n=1 Tax=Lyngbya aestuarii BL J TaxID=1348334 RepID=U7QJ33_9CYAN|nr:hypothetical protein M595_2061 [Lyngbya aestuarii BL J]
MLNQALSLSFACHVFILQTYYINCQGVWQKFFDPILVPRGQIRGKSFNSGVCGVINYR